MIMVMMQEDDFLHHYHFMGCRLGSGKCPEELGPSKLVTNSRPDVKNGQSLKITLSTHLS